MDVICFVVMLRNKGVAVEGHSGRGWMEENARNLSVKQKLEFEFEQRQKGILIKELTKNGGGVETVTVIVTVTGNRQGRCGVGAELCFMLISNDIWEL